MSLMMFFVLHLCHFFRVSRYLFGVFFVLEKKKNKIQQLLTIVREHMYYYAVASLTDAAIWPAFSSRFTLFLWS